MPPYTSTVIRKTKTEVVTGSTGSFFLWSTIPKTSPKRPNTYTRHPQKVSPGTPIHTYRRYPRISPPAIAARGPASRRKDVFFFREKRPAIVSSSSRPRTRMVLKHIPARYPISPQENICHGVHGPCPEKKLQTNRASAPTKNPVSGPSAMPLITTMAVPA